MRTIVIGLVLLLVFFCACAQKNQDEKGILVGKLKMNDVYRTCPRFRQIRSAYEPDEGVVQRLRDIERPIRVKVFLGTWCSDSEEHVPPFDALFKAVANPQFEVEYYGVDRDKSDGLGLAQRFKIQYVPTFIFFEDSKEIGRIVETPTMSIAEDVLNILEGTD